MNEEEGKLVVSQRRALMENQKDLTKGEVVGGVITGLRQYGAFLELDVGWQASCILARSHTIASTTSRVFSRSVSAVRL